MSVLTLLIASGAAIAIFIAAVAKDVLKTLLTNEAEGWLAHLTSELLNAAVEQLPQEDRERWASEWAAELASRQERPFTALMFAGGLKRAARTLASESAHASAGVPNATGLSRRARGLKRSFDVLGSALVLLGVAPLMCVISVAIKLTSPGPVFFRLTRIGADGRRFHMLKFRSMYVDVDSFKNAPYEPYEQEGPFRIAADPRITRVGRLLRGASLDELPQIINVLRGEMSLVGPRPLFADEDGSVEALNRRRAHLTPGMTGPWQLLDASHIPFREMLAIDYLYVANWSLWTDLKIMLRTIVVVLTRGPG